MSNQAIEWQEHVLEQLQSGAISVEEAEQLLLNPEKRRVASVDGGAATAEPLEKPIDIASAPRWRGEQSDVAIIGMSCRFPGARTWQEFWKNLKNGVDSVTEVPKGRWHEDGWFDPNPQHPGTSYSQWGGFLEDVEQFDARFFEISPAEAKIMDPQQRIFLEEAYHAIENGGYATDMLKGQKCGVFVGATMSDYADRLSSAGLSTSRFTLTGLAPSLLAARIAYFLDLQGPAISIDTACSSSLVAVHQACESIRSGEVDLALAGGVTLLLTPLSHIRLSQSQMLSPAAQCRSFDESASGIVLAEGCGVLFLKNAAQAIQDNDHIVAIIKGSGVNQNGSTNGITAPSAKSQARLIKRIYERFDIDPESIGYVEAHGTGTSLGDPIEVAALTDAFAHFTHHAGVASKKQFCAIGSVKNNIGHSLFASGMAGVIKAALCLKYGELVPSLHFNRPNPKIDFQNSPFYVNTSHKKWSGKRAAIHSFGLSGTNAHAVLERAPVRTRSYPQSKTKAALHLLTLSAKTQTALHELVARYEKYLATTLAERCPEPVEGLADICFTANTGRSHFTHRLAVVAGDKSQMIGKLAAFNAGNDVSGVFVTPSTQADAVSDRTWSLNWHQAELSNTWGELAKAYVCGAEIDWVDFHRGCSGQRVILPTYPFQREKYWVEPTKKILSRRRTERSTTSQELQARIYSALLKSGDVQLAEAANALFDELLGPDAENLIAYRRERRHGTPIAVKLTSYGKLDNLTVRPMPIQPLGAEEVEIEVRASGLNFRDVLRALGMMREVEDADGLKSATDISFGFECAGIIRRVGEQVSGFKVGDAVIATMMMDSLASLVTAQAKFVVPKPPEMSFSEAATIPIAFLTAYYGLVTCARIGPTDRVLIHAAAGGVGQAAIQLAQSVGAEVLATASPPKWEFLSSFGIQHIYNSRTLEFAEEVMTFTNGEGVDVVLNSLNGAFIDKTAEVLAKGGRFVEIGKLGIWDEPTMQAVRPDVAYFPFDLGDVEPSQISSMLAQLMTMFREGTLKPLPLKAFPIRNVVKAFRYMQQAKHIGKVVITFPQKAPLELGGTEGALGDGHYLITEALEEKNVLEAGLNSSELIQQLEVAPIGERKRLLTAYIRSIVGSLLEMPPEQIKPRDRLFELGVDSLMAVELKNHLEADLGRSLRSTTVFHYPTLEALSDYLAQDVLDFSDENELNRQHRFPQDASSAESASQEVEKLSEDEIETSIEMGLAKLELLLGN